MCDALLHKVLLPFAGIETSAAVHSSTMTHSQPQDNLSFHYGHSSSWSVLHPFPVQPKKTMPIFVKRKAIATEESRFNSGNKEPYHTPNKSTMKLSGALSQDTYGRAPFLSSHKVSLLKNGREPSTSAGKTHNVNDSWLNDLHNNMIGLGFTL